MWITGWSDIDRELAALDDFRRRMDRMFQGLEPGSTDDRPFVTSAWPRANLFDFGTTMVLQAEVPGLSDKDIQISGTQEALTISGERKADAPEGYSVHRRERGAVQFSRSFALPCQVDLERATASVKNGLLTVTLAKAPEAQPRQITVRAQ